MPLNMYRLWLRVGTKPRPLCIESVDATAGCVEILASLAMYTPAMHGVAGGIHWGAMHLVAYIGLIAAFGENEIVEIRGHNDELWPPLFIIRPATGDTQSHGIVFLAEMSEMDEPVLLAINNVVVGIGEDVTAIYVGPFQ